MGDKSAIEWTATVHPDGSVTAGATWNPVTGCSKVSPGCAHCYAETVALRFWPSQYPPVEYDTYSVDACCPITEMRAREFTDVQCHEDRLDQPLRWRKPRRIFVNSMSDLFHEDIPDSFIDRVFAVMATAPRHTFQVLTKRADRMRAYLADPLRRQCIAEAWWDAQATSPTVSFATSPLDTWPLPNVWLGVSVENQHFADERIPLLLQTPAAVRFISAEPLLERVQLAWEGYGPYEEGYLRRGIDWVIVGGESGPGARPFDLAWARAILSQCRGAGVPCFVKQLGAVPVNAILGPVNPVNLRTVGAIRDRKGGDPNEWPADLRVREFPAALTLTQG